MADSIDKILAIPARILRFFFPKKTQSYCVSSEKNVHPFRVTDPVFYFKCILGKNYCFALYCFADSVGKIELATDPNIFKSDPNNASVIIIETIDREGKLNFMKPLFEFYFSSL